MSDVNRALRIRAEQDKADRIKSKEQDAAAKAKREQWRLEEANTVECKWCRRRAPVAKKHGWYGNLIILDHERYPGEACSGVGRRTGDSPPAGPSHGDI